jgi:hypothetical protein
MTTRQCLWKAVRNVVVIRLTRPLQGVAGPGGARGEARSKGAGYEYRAKPGEVSARPGGYGIRAQAAFGAFLAALASARAGVQGVIAGGIAAVEDALQPVIRLLGL